MNQSSTYKYGFFERASKGKLYFDNIRDWYNWQEKWLLEYVSKKFEEQNRDVIFEDKNSKFYHSKTEKDIHLIDNANVRLYIDKIVVEFLNKKEKLILNFNELQTINPQLHERLEIFYNNEAYRIIGSRPGVSALKWDVAVNAILKKMGQTAKLSPYIDSSSIETAEEHIT